MAGRLEELVLEVRAFIDANMVPEIPPFLFEELFSEALPCSADPWDDWAEQEELKAAEPKESGRKAKAPGDKSRRGLHIFPRKKEGEPEVYSDLMESSSDGSADFDDTQSLFSMSVGSVFDSFDPTEPMFVPDESFAEAVLRLIDEKGMTDPQCYTRANLSRAVFNKLKQSALNPAGSEYRPSKETALALTMGLSLSLEEARSLLEKAGFALSHSNKRDLIVEFFLMHENHNIYELNEILFRFDQQPIGSF